MRQQSLSVIQFSPALEHTPGIGTFVGFGVGEKVGAFVLTGFPMGAPVLVGASVVGDSLGCSVGKDVAMVC